MSRKQKWAVVLAIFFAGSCSIADAEIPRGIFALGKASQPIADQILNNPYVTGVSIRVPWKEIEPEEGRFEWGSLKKEMERVRAASKVATLRVMSAAPSLPNWLLKKIHTLEITDENEYHKTARQKIRAHVFWDPEFLKAKKNLYAEMGRQFGSDTNLKVVGIAFANTHSEDWSVPVKGASRAAWLTAGYTPERFIDAGKQTLDAAMTAFPNSAILLAVGNNPLDTDTLNVPRTVIRYANERYPGRLIVQLNRLAAKSPLPAEANGPWKLLMENRPFVAGQMLWNVSGDSSYRMNKKMPGNPRQILSEAIEKGFAYGMCYIEVYVRDILDPGMRPVLAEASAKMHSS